jgi:alpha-amylase/alpha-mannosidase (GH57 family)
MTALIIHGHFYQPPRENPWTGTIDTQPGAYPYHDWNERIHDECYGPNAFAHIVNSAGTIERTVNNYASISFNFGPTLLSWLERYHPQTYQRILSANKASVAIRGGHGNAIAQAYGHAILPLCNSRDRLTQVVWGIADFRHRFGREPEALWLPETACNDETLELLIEQQLRFVILAPGQAERYRPIGSKEWRSLADSTIDTTRAYRYSHSDDSGRSIAVFFYDGRISQSIAFERALFSSQFLVGLFKRAAEQGPLVNIATDGETYGHHFKFGDLCLAHALEVEARDEGFWLTNYAQFLDHHPPEFEIEIKKGPNEEGTAWSCAHGVGRWIRDCGCDRGEPNWNQKWRTPLRTALDFLRDEASDHFETVGGDLFIDPWGTRNAYIELILDQGRSREDFLKRQAGRSLSPPDQARALTLLELQRNALLMYTSCGWFFSEISGIEAVQIMKYAARAIELFDELGLPSPRSRFLEILAEAKSNIREMGTGADVYLRLAEPPLLSNRELADTEPALS